MSELLKEIRERRARRALSPQPVDEAAVDRLLTAATYAPSCYNNQPWRLMAVTDPQALAQIHPALTAGNYWARKAPLMVVVATRPDLDARLSDRRDYALYDCGLAAMNLILQAQAEGLIAHPMAGFDPGALKAAFGIPDGYIVINVIAVGRPGSPGELSDKHAAAEQAQRSRKPPAEVICRNRWTLG